MSAPPAVEAGRRTRQVALAGPGAGSTPILRATGRLLDIAGGVRSWRSV